MRNDGGAGYKARFAGRVILMMPNHERVLVTGINGFTGHYVRETLERIGYVVHGSVRPSESTSPFRHAVELLDSRRLREIVEIVKPTYVIHLAAVAFVSHDAPDEIYQTNIVGTRNLLSTLAASQHAGQIRGILLASSANIYGNADVEFIDEEQRPKPINDYAVSKLAMEHVAALWSDRLPITVLRPFNYTGVGQSVKFLIPKIVDAFASSAPSLRLGNLHVSRDFLDVRDVAEAYAKLMTLSPRTTINICSGHSTPLHSVLDIAESISGHKLEIVSAAELARTFEVHVLRGNATRLLQFIPDWKPRPLRDTLEWMFSVSAIKRPGSSFWTN